MKITHSIPIFLSSDDNYAPFVATTIASMCYNTKSFLNFYILDGGISQFHKRQIAILHDQFKNFSIEFIYIDVNKQFNQFIQPNIIHPLSMYTRLLIPQLKHNFDRVIYSDVDVIALGDIADMYNQHLSNYSLGAIYHAYFEKNKLMSKKIKTQFALSDYHKFFYSGNLLIDCKKWRDDNIIDKLFCISHNYKSYFIHGDQDVLNKCFDNNYKQLDSKFCLTTQDCDYFYTTNKAEYIRLSRDVVIRHFETRSKPWLTDVFYEGRPLENFHDFWFFAAMTPFYHGLQQKFIASRARNEVFSYEILGNIKKPDRHLLGNLREKISYTKKD